MCDEESHINMHYIVITPLDIQTALFTVPKEINNC
jgi:hypothetical protein